MHALILFSKGLKNMLNLIVIAFSGSISEKFYCCIDNLNFSNKIALQYQKQEAENK